MTKTTKKILVTMLVLILISAAVMTLSPVFARAEEQQPYDAVMEKIYNREYDCYTDSDFLYLGDGSFSQTSIQNYAERNTRFTEAPNADDDIAKIIPRELFVVPGEYIYIGKEYGFYIETVQYKKINLSNENYSRVLLFDIETNTEALENGNASFYTVKVKNLFTYGYYFLTRDVSRNNYNYKLLFGESTWTFPVPENNLNNIIIADHDNSPLPQISIEDIYINSLLYNEYDSNFGDANYVSENDGGMYFVGSESAYYLTVPNPEIKNKQINLIGGLAGENIFVGVGLILGAAIGGPAGAVAGTQIAREIYAGINFIIDVVDLMNEMENAKIVKSSGNISPDGEFYNPFEKEFMVSKQGQLENYGYLIRSIAGHISMGNDRF